MGLTYKLGKKSLPHITLAQFAHSGDEIELSELWSEFLYQYPDFQNLEFSLTHTKVKNEANGYHWLQLQLKKEDEFSSCPARDLHYNLVEHLREKGIEPKNAALENYDPHLTLSHTCDAAMIQRLNDQIGPLLPISSKFKLVLGRSDADWQLVEELYSIDYDPSFTRLLNYLAPVLTRPFYPQVPIPDSDTGSFPEVPVIYGCKK